MSDEQYINDENYNNSNNNIKAKKCSCMLRPNITAARNKTIILKLKEELLIFVKQHTPSTKFAIC